MINPSDCNMLRNARLTEHDLSDGLKLLVLQEGRFWPAALNSTPLPDVYGIVMEKQRGNRPQILHPLCGQYPPIPRSGSALLLLLVSTAPNLLLGSWPPNLCFANPPLRSVL